MRVNINNTETIEVEDRDEAVAVIGEKMKPWMQEGDRLVWYYAEIPETLETPPDTAVVANELGECKDDFARIISEKP